MVFLRTAALLGAYALLLYAPPARAFDPCADAPRYTPVESRYTKGLLFKIEKCKSPVSYILGTVHINKPSVDAAAGGAFRVLKDVQSAGFELPDLAADGTGAQLMRYAFLPQADKGGLSRQLGKDYFGRLLAEIRFMAFARGRFISEQQLGRMRPWVAEVVLQSLDDDPGMVLDEKLWVAATLAGKPTFGLETADEQMSALSGLPERLQVRMLKEEIDHYPEMLKDKAALIDAYAAGDARKIQAIEEEDVAAGDDPELGRILRDRLLVQRNLNMERRLLPRLNKESVLLSVGLLHLPGEDGILRLLEKDGYFVTPMP